MSHARKDWCQYPQASRLASSLCLCIWLDKPSRILSTSQCPMNGIHHFKSERRVTHSLYESCGCAWHLERSAAASHVEAPQVAVALPRWAPCHCAVGCSSTLFLTSICVATLGGSPESPSVLPSSTCSAAAVVAIPNLTEIRC